MKKEFINPTDKLKATIAILRKENTALKKKLEYLDENIKKIIKSRVKLILQLKNQLRDL